MRQNISCCKCKRSNDFDIPISIESFVCQHCRTLNVRNNNGWEKIGRQEKFITHIPLYSEAKIEGKKYCVTGILFKKASVDYKWKEYILNAEDGSSLIITESDGHWILMRPIEDQYDLGNLQDSLFYQNKDYRLYDVCQSETLDVMGAFDYAPILVDWNVYTYVCETEMLSIEGNNDSQESYRGRHLSFRELRSYFPEAKWTYKQGIGIVQPPKIPATSSAVIGFATILLLLFIQLYFQSIQKRQDLYNAQMSLAPQNNEKEFATPSFELKGASAPLTIDVETNLDNNWTTINVALVNEKTSETQYASKDIEYYEGVADGEKLSEGSQNESFNICGIGAGKYHLIVSPSFEVTPVDSSSIVQHDSSATLIGTFTHPSPTLKIRATWKPTYNNIIIFCTILGIFSVCALIGGYYYEREKWRYSDYSPYNYEN